MWVEADEECTFERYIQKGLAQYMTQLGITLVKKLNPNIKTLSLEDTSSFLCKLPNNKEIRVPMKSFHIAFHGATWYEYYFNAKLKNRYEEYVKLKENMYKKDKPNTFDFINKDLQRELMPLYKEASCWYDFFKMIEEKYNKHKCAIVYPWIQSAMNDIFKDDNIYENTKWYIDLIDNNKISILDISIHNLKKIQEGGRRKTIKKRRERRFTFSRTHFFPDIPKIEELDYNKFFSVL
jgi:hypothetical protein